jgi:hypothetical protein
VPRGSDTGALAPGNVPGTFHVEQRIFRRGGPEASGCCPSPSARAHQASPARRRPCFAALRWSGAPFRPPGSLMRGRNPDASDVRTRAALLDTGWPHLFVSRVTPPPRTAITSRGGRSRGYAEEGHGRTYPTERPISRFRWQGWTTFHVERASLECSASAARLRPLSVIRAPGAHRAATPSVPLARRPPDPVRASDGHSPARAAGPPRAVRRDRKAHPRICLSTDPRPASPA